jgi:hypothetical protein
MLRLSAFIRRPTHLPVFENYLAMNQVDIRIVESDAASRIPSEREFFVVYPETGDDGIGFLPFHKAECSISSYLTVSTGVHGGSCN